MTDSLNISRGPLILGAGGRLGKGLFSLWKAGHLPELGAPHWQSRSAPDMQNWDFSRDRPPDRLAPRGMIVLAGVTSGSDAALAANAALALAACDLALQLNIGPVLLLSSAAVYGRAAGPQAEALNPLPANAYGSAKLEMERAVASHAARPCCLRSANVAGFDALFGAAGRGPVQLDQFADGSSPRRAYIGPLSLGRCLATLLAAPSLPPLLNLAAPSTASMSAILQAAQLEWTWVSAPQSALRDVSLDTGLLQSIAPVPAAANLAETLVSQARLAGWTPWL
ncbi:MAG: NAD-dependent epimerase/dehydratase family protein [Rhodobacteraceae bacterium]|nr:NAD-dependent epimerase/dehydratase family protein [Paracoccaceae bacterium]